MPEADYIIDRPYYFGDLVKILERKDGVCVIRHILPDDKVVDAYFIRFSEDKQKAFFAFPCQMCKEYK